MSLFPLTPQQNRTVSHLDGNMRARMVESIQKSLYEVHDEQTVALIIPTMNEEENIAWVLKRIPRRVVDEVIVVDSSNDNTPNIARELGVRVVLEDRKGYGRALQTGIENSHCSIVVYMDGDGTYDPWEIPELIEPIIEDGYQSVLGTRMYDEMDRSLMSMLKRMGNAALSSIFRIIYDIEISDTQTGFRAFVKECIHDLSLKHYGMSYVTEQLIKMIKKGVSVREVPITYKPRIGGRSKLKPVKDGLSILWVMIKEKI